VYQSPREEIIAAEEVEKEVEKEVERENLSLESLRWKNLATV